MTTIILGATAGVGRCLAERLAIQGEDLLLSARDPADLSALARSLKTTYGVRVSTVCFDSRQLSKSIELMDQAIVGMSDLQALLFPIGLSSELDSVGSSAALVEDLTAANLTAVIAVSNHFIPKLLNAKHPWIAGFGSVAEYRGRSANVTYAAAKRGLAAYFESLRHALAGTKARVQYFRLGYVATAQTFGKRLPFPAASPEHIAEITLRARNRRAFLITVPWFWRVIGVGVKSLPWIIFKRVKF